MSANAKMGDGQSRFPWRIVTWSGVVLILLLPLVAGAPWTLSDYIVAGVLLGGSGLVLEFAVRASGNLSYRAGAALAVAAAVLLVWVNGAVGFLGSEDNPANLMFFGVAGIAVLGSVLAGFRPGGMARTMFGAAAAQVLVGVVGLAWGLGSVEPARLHEAVMGTSVFTALWLLSAGLFRKAEGEAEAR